MKLKICGMKYQDNIQEVAQLSPDYLGFIFYKASARNFTGNIPTISDSIKKVGVFVNEDIKAVAQNIQTYKLDVIQLHGNESPCYVKELKELLKNNTIQIIKVFAVKDTFDFSLLEPYEGLCDYFLFDTKGKLPGGNGYTFDWSVLENYPSQTPFFLSGGIGNETITKLQSFIKSDAAKHCIAIDVNSRFEIAPGKKDCTQLTNFKEFLTTY